MFFALLAVAAAVPAQTLPFTDHGAFRITSNGQVLGTERFDIEAAGTGFRLRGELKIKTPGGEATESSVMNVARDLTVTSYTRVQKSPKKASVQVDFVGGHAKAHYITPDGPSDYEYMLENAVVILDTNFFHHFALLLQRYDFKKGGAQHVQVLIPQEASPGMILLSMESTFFVSVPPYVPTSSPFRSLVKCGSMYAESHLDANPSVDA